MTHQETAAPSTQRKKGLATRKRILHAAVELFADRPFEEVQVYELAEHAGVAHGLIFHHFGNKRGIYLEAVHEISRRLFALPVRDPALTPYHQIRQLIRDHFQHMADNQALLLGYIRGSIAMKADPEAWAVLEAYRAELSSWALQLFGLDPHSAALRLMIRVATSGMDELSVNWLQGGRIWDLDTQMVQATIQLIAGAFNAAAGLDPSLDVRRGLDLLLDPDAVGPARTADAVGPPPTAG